MKFYKITNEEENHRGLQYQDGLIVDIQPFKPYGDCLPGGIYFAREDILYFLDYGPWIREVTIPPGAQVYENPGYPQKWKADKVVLGPRHRITDEVCCSLLDAGMPTDGGILDAVAYRLTEYDMVGALLKILTRIDMSDRSLRRSLFDRAFMDGSSKAVDVLSLSLDHDDWERMLNYFSMEGERVALSILPGFPWNDRAFSAIIKQNYNINIDELRVQGEALAAGRL
jgi:hypothetical protein